MTRPRTSPGLRRPARAPRRRARARWRFFWAVPPTAALLFLAGLFVGRNGDWSRPRPTPEPPTAGAAGEPAPGGEATPRPRARPDRRRPGPATPPSANPPSRGGGADRSAAVTPARLALVIDDLGRRPEDLDAIGALDIPVAYALLPFEPHTATMLARLREARAEILCHLPMEGEATKDPGPGALRLGLEPAEIARLTRAALDAVPGAVGVNNHMGSAFSANGEAMDAMLAVVARRGLFFLDSRTSAASVGFARARSGGLAALERQVFLDDDASAQAVDRQFDAWLAAARREGVAIAIGHPRPSTLEVLARRVPAARAAGFRFVSLRSLLGPSTARHAAPAR